MAIKTLEIDHILVFQELSLSFGNGINVLIGENGLGKTSILKMIYAATQATIDSNKHLQRHLEEYFLNQSTENDSKFVNQKDETVVGTFRVSDGQNYYSERYMAGQKNTAVDNKDLNHIERTMNRFRSQNENNWSSLNIPSVYIPATEMLSHANGFLALNQKYNMPFDATQVDIVVNASLPEAKKVPEFMDDILTQISKAINGTVVQENDTFYVVKKDGRKVEFSLEAEGLRKLGLLWKLIRNGLLEPGAVLLWDEPEANLNPELYDLVADILLTLSKNGVQIFAATHSYNFAKYLEIRRKQKESVQFINLYQNDQDQVQSQTAYYLQELNPNHIMEADEKLLDEVYKDA